MEQKLYFGHPVNTYGTELEQFLRKVIADTFPEWTLVDPNTPQHERGYIRWKEKTDVGMDYFLKYLLPRCHRGIFLPFRSGYWPSGEALEIQCLAAKKHPLERIDMSGRIFPMTDLSREVFLTRQESIFRVRHQDIVAASGAIVRGSRIPY